MAALRNLIKRKSHLFLSKEKLICTSTSPLVDTPSFAQRLRDLPKDLPGTNIKKQVSQLIGRTPLVYLNKVTEGCGAYVAVKQEMMQPTASIKDRPALAMITDAEKKGLITPGKTTLIEPTSGNMGISMAFMAAMKGYKMLLESTPDAFMLQQFSNPANTQIHFETTGPEIWEDTNGKVDIFIMGIGSGGTVSGIYGLEPAESNILNGGKPGIYHVNIVLITLLVMELIQTDILDIDVMEEVLMVSSEDAVNMARQLALKEGLMVGISSGANTVAALRLAKRPENKGKLIVTIHPSFGERYLSSVLFQELRMK
ncbi:hypothetical protein DH2020_002142 [Rehmannia glutinosa]|uniref:Tryptophan synthase beta chain-like PALP domain-containing protein n=1 Tax=Rehmannia glutinosa TaxID=99300 RepID=A0ABR0XTH6_REHGL